MKKTKRIRKKHIFRAIATVLVVAITAISIDNSGRVQTGIKKQAAQSVGTTVYAKTESSDITESFGNEIRIIKSGLDRADKDEVVNSLKRIEKQAEYLKKEIESQFKEAEEKITDMDLSEAGTRLEEFKQTTGSGFVELEESIEAAYENVAGKSLYDAKKELLKVSEKAAAMVETKEHFAEITEMPHNTVDAYRAKELVGEQTPNLQAYDIDDEADYTDTPDYTAVNSQELRLDEDMKEVADSLETPVNIYEYVKNTMDYRMYYGSRYGAVGTFSQQAGNDYDQASLLIAMLRYKGYEARYVTGTVEYDIDKAMNLTGAQTPKGAVDVMSMLGVPVGYMTTNGQISLIRVEHVWVEVKVPYDDYRGAGNIRGEMEWIPLDPSFKEYEENEKLKLSDITDYSEEDIQHMFYMTGRKTEYGETLLNADEMMELYDEVEAGVEAYVEENDIDSKKAEELIGKRIIKKEESGVLPNALPYRVVGETTVYDVVPREAVAEITLSLTKDFYGSYFMDIPDVSVTYDASQLYGKRVTIAYAPETPEDEKLIESYGGIYETPSYLVRLVPQILIDGEVAAQGSAVMPGEYFEATVEIKQAGCDKVKVDNPLIAGGSYAIAFDYGTISSSQVSEYKEELGKLIKATDDGVSNENDDVCNDNSYDDVCNDSNYNDDVTGEMLHCMGILYFCQNDIFGGYIASASDVRAERLISEAIVGKKPAVGSMFGVPVSIDEGTYYFDVDTDMYGVASLNENKAATRAYMLMSGIVGSKMESAIFEQTVGVPSASTISILQEANERGVGIATITGDNAEIVDKLNIDETAKNEISRAVKNGKVVIVPESEICFYEWKGTGYIIIDPETCGAAYMISGSICGGIAVIFSIAVGVVNILWAMYDLMDIVLLMMVTTNPLAMVGLFALYLISFVALINSISTMLAYCTTMDDRYVGNMAFDLAMNIVISGAVVFFKSILKNLDELFEDVMKRLDDVDNGVGGSGTGSGGTGSGPDGGSTGSGTDGGNTGSGPDGGNTGSGPDGGNTGSGPDGGNTGSGPDGGSTGSGTDGGSTGSGTDGGNTGSGTDGGSTGSGPDGGNTGSGTDGGSTGSGPDGGSTGSGSDGGSTGSGTDGGSSGSGTDGGSTGSGTDGDGSKPVGGETGSPDTPIDELVDYWKWLEENYGIGVSKVIAEHGEQGAKLMQQYGARLAKAIDQADNADDIIRLLTQYSDDGDTVLTAIYNYGDDAIRLIDNYGDEATTQFRIGKTLDEIEILFEGGTDVISDLSKTALKHPMNEHMPKKYANQLQYITKEIAEQYLESKTFFNPNWTEEQVEAALNYGYKEALNNGVDSGIYSFKYLGENVTIYLEEGVFKTGYGDYVFTYDELISMYGR